ncbi:MAG: signal transduction histidine kinase [Reinekea sp.]|jgi:signal transduction histidine kinase
MMLLMFATAYGDSTASLPLQHFTSVELTQVDSRYSLASLPYSSGFMQVNEKDELEWAPDIPSSTQKPFGLNPDFGQLKRYWLYTRVANLSDSDNWVLHISNFGFNAFKVLVRGDNEQTVKVFDNSMPSPEVDINALGRAVEVTLKPKVEYLIIVELAASHAVWHPYIGLMAEGYYQDWQTKMDFTAKVAIGVVLGMILLAVLCWALLKDVTFFWAAFSSFLLLCYYLEHSSLPAVFWGYNYEKTGLFWFLVSAMFISVLGFAASFLQVGRKEKWYYLFAGAVLMTVLVYALSTVTTFYISSLLYAFNSIVVWIVILSSGIAKVRSEGRYYLIYILGWLPLVLSILQVIWVVNTQQKYVHEVSISYKVIEVLYIHIAHMIIHAIAMIQRYKTMRADKQKAEYLSFAKSRFIAQSSHDLRQPLHSMHIFLEYLKPHINGEEASDIFNKLNKTYRHMDESFSILMDLSKLEAGAVRADIHQVELTHLFLKLEQEYKWQASEKGIQFIVQKSSVAVFTDPILLERMLRNLISNALKFTPSGKVILGCRRRGRDVHIQVVDNGKGIPEQEKEIIFDIYSRSMYFPDQVEGSGIGLSVVKHLADLLNHPLSVSSKLNQGSIFTLAVPNASELSMESEQKEDKKIASVINVGLIIRDDQCRQIVEQRLQQWNCRYQLYDSFDSAVNSGAATGALICDDFSVTNTLIRASDLAYISQQKAIACITYSPERLPSTWAILSYPVLPTQLRAFLNFANRRVKTIVEQS